MRGTFTPEQTEVLLRPIHPGRVYTSQGQSHLAGWDVRAHLTRMFGFGNWEKHVTDLTLVSEVPIDRKNDKGEKTGMGWWVTYRCTMRLDVRVAGALVWSSEDCATGSAENQPRLGEAHDLAVKNAVTYTLKRCAIDLGDQFGLSLYNKGKTDAVVRSIVGHHGDVNDTPTVEDEGEVPNGGG